MGYANILIHSENENELIPYLPNIDRLSNWVSGSWGKSQYILNKKIPNDYIILPMYLNDKGIQDEWQSQISGKAKKNESIFEATQREIFEEIGIAFDIETIMRGYIDREDFRGCNVHYFNLNLINSVDTFSNNFDEIIEHCKNRSCLADDKYTRISVFIHFNQINKDNINKIISRHRIECNDDAGKTIMIIPKNVLYPIVQDFDFKKKKKKKSLIIL